MTPAADDPRTRAALTGYQANFNAQVLTASLLCVVLAVAFDLLLLGVQRLATPWRRS